MAVTFDPVLTWMAAATVAIILLVGACQKLSDLDAFKAALENYALLPAALLAPTAWLLPLGEAAAGLALVIEPTRAFGAVAALALLALVTAGVIVNLLRGRTDIGCGCGGIEDEQQLSWSLVLRNALLALLVGLSLAAAPARALVWLDYLSVGAGAATLYGIYVLANQLIANQPRLWRLRSSR